MVRQTETSHMMRDDAETKSKEFPYCVVIRLRWKGPFHQHAPLLINLILSFNTMHENRFIVQLVPIRVFFPSMGPRRWLAGWLAGGEASFTCDHNVLKFETFPHFLTGALTFVYIKNLVGCRRVDAV